MTSTVGERITQARQARGLSQGQLARECDIAATQLSRYETGRAEPRKLALARLSQALAVNLKWLETGVGSMDEFPESDPGGMTFTLDRELSARLRAYARYNDLTIAEALAEMLDFALSGYGEADLPKTPAEEAAFRKMLSTYGSKMVRKRVLAGKIYVHSAGESSVNPKVTGANVILVGNIGREAPSQEFVPGEDPGTKHRPAAKRQFSPSKK